MDDKAAIEIGTEPLLEHDTVELARQIRERCVSPVEVVDASLGRIEAADPALNACAGVYAEEARSAARAAERALVDEADIGPLHGIPVAIKDSIWIGGKPSTAGSRAFADFVAPEDSVAVARLRAAGAIVIARTTMSEIGAAGRTASKLYGVTRNPWALQRSPGGSSGGSAAAVAAGMVPLALGTDAGGSIRKPAAYCGIVGMKPTFGRVPNGPGVARWQTLVALGPLARSVRDLSLALEVLSGGDPRDPRSLPVAGLGRLDGETILPQRPRFAWSADFGVAELEPDIRIAFAAAIERLGSLPGRLEQASPPAEDVGETTWQVLLAEAGRPPDGRGHLIDDPEAIEIFDRSHDMTAFAAQQAQLARGRITRAWDEFFRDFDILLAPSVGYEPPPADPADESPGGQTVRENAFALLAAANLTGQPALNLPAGFTRSGLPFGIQVIGPRGADALCLAAAGEVERALGFEQPRHSTIPLVRG